MVLRSDSALGFKRLTGKCSSGERLIYLNGYTDNSRNIDSLE